MPVSLYRLNRPVRSAGGAAAVLSLTLVFALSGCPNSESLPAPLAGPSGLSARAGVERILLTWSPLDGASGYDLYWASSPVSDLSSATKAVGASSPWLVTGLTNGTRYYFRVVATVNGEETAPSEEKSAACGYVLGGLGPGGGYLFYDKGSYSDGWRYLECAPSDQSAGIAWGYQGNVSTKSGANIGAGAGNTAAIVLWLGTGSSYAARTCGDLSLGGYDDWFLPSIKEMEQMRSLYQAGLGGFSTEGYWTSTFAPITSTDPISEIVLILGGIVVSASSGPIATVYVKVSSLTTMIPLGVNPSYRVRAARRF